MRAFVTVFVTYLLLTSCVDKVVCPAFQSTYILDDSTRMAYYSYVWKLDETARREYLAAVAASNSDSAGNTGVYTGEDESMSPYYTYLASNAPISYPVKKSKYGVVKYEPYWLKNYKLRTAPMEDEYGPKAQQITEEPIDQGEFYASDFQGDSLMLADSVSLVSGDSVVIGEPIAAADSKPEKKERKYLYRYKEDDNFNVEQEYYNKYFGELLVDNRPEVEQPQVVDATLPDSVQTEKEGMFSRMFKKKDKQKSDSLNVETPTDSLSFGN